MSSLERSSAPSTAKAKRAEANAYFRSPVRCASETEFAAVAFIKAEDPGTCIFGVYHALFSRAGGAERPGCGHAGRAHRERAAGRTGCCMTRVAHKLHTARFWTPKKAPGCTQTAKNSTSLYDKKAEKHRCFSAVWLRRLDLNQRPSGYECGFVVFTCFSCDIRNICTHLFPDFCNHSFAL